MERIWVIEDDRWCASRDAGCLAWLAVCITGVGTLRRRSGSRQWLL